MPTVFITAGTHNTGLAIAEKFAREGFDVAISGRNTEEITKAESYLKEKYSVTAKGYILDITDVKQINDVFNNIHRDFGRIDTFVANAANLGVDMNILEITEEEYHEISDTNLKGTFFCAQKAAILMKETGGGSIVFISSVHSHQCIFGRSLYTATKGAINALMRSMALELGHLGIRANCIIAGAIKTNRWNALTEEQIAQKRSNWPLGIESTGQDIANGVYYLGSELSNTVTGTELTIDSGVSLCLLPYNTQNK